MADIVAIFRDNPRRVVNESINKVVMDAVCGSSNLGGVTHEFLSLYAGLMSAVHVQTDPSTGAYFLEQLALAFQTAHAPGPTQHQKAATNLVQMLVHFYLCLLYTSPSPRDS